MLQQMFEVTDARFHAVMQKNVCATDRQCWWRYSAADRTTRQSDVASDRPGLGSPCAPELGHGNRHHQRLAERWTCTEWSVSGNIALLWQLWHVNAVVLKVDRQSDSENLLVREEDEFDGRLRVQMQQFLCTCQTCVVIGGSQLLRATFLETFESQIFANNLVHRGVMDTSLSGNLARWSVRLWHIFLTQDQVINCVDVVVYPCTSRASTVASSCCRTSVSKFSQQFIQSVRTPTFIWKLCNKFFSSVTFKNVKIFYQNSIIIAETHVYVKVLSATRQRSARALGAYRIE